MRPRLNIVGRRYGDLTIVAEHPSIPRITRTGNPYITRIVTVKCDCGAEKIISHVSMTNGSVKSCGCRRRGQNFKTRQREVHGTHLATVNNGFTAEYRSWSSMKTRCYNPKQKNFSCYGGRGITVCDRWRNDFAAFLADMGPRPSMKHTLDRFPDNNGNYQPGNCRWATAKEQSANRRPPSEWKPRDAKARAA